MLQIKHLHFLHSPENIHVPNGSTLSLSTPAFSKLSKSMIIHYWKIFPTSSLFLLVIKYTFSQASCHGLCQPREAVSGQAGVRVDLPLVKAQDIRQLICHIPNHSPSGHVLSQQENVKRLISEDVMVHPFLSLTLFAVPPKLVFWRCKKNFNLKYCSDKH